MTGHTNQSHHRHQLGLAGEAFVVQLLRQAGWQILQTRWHCRWGEIDIIAADSEWLIFVEVKTRQAHRGSMSLDAQGRLAVDSRKQQKLCLAAQVFLSEFVSQFPTQSVPLHHRFDVALVGYTPANDASHGLSHHALGNCLHLIEYLPHAFTLDLA